jgi:hypothetical protein
MDAAAILQGLLVVAFLLALFTGSAVLFGLLRIASAGGIGHIETYPTPGVSLRAQATSARMRERYLGRRFGVGVPPAASRARVIEAFVADEPAVAAIEVGEPVTALLVVPQDVAA